MKKFLVVVDTQYDFVMPNGALYVQSAEEIVVPGIEFLANLDPEIYEGVLFTYDTHHPILYQGSPESEQFPIHCVHGTSGWNNVFNESLIPRGIKVHKLEKRVFDMWQEEDIEISTEVKLGDADLSEFNKRDSFFHKLGLKGIHTVQVFGVASDFCVKWAVDGFAKRGFDVEVIEELCRGIGAPAGDVFEGPDYENVKLV